jgi:hypothetical protein
MIVARNGRYLAKLATIMSRLGGNERFLKRRV